MSSRIRVIAGTPARCPTVPLWTTVGCVTPVGPLFRIAESRTAPASSAQSRAAFVPGGTGVRIERDARIATRAEQPGQPGALPER